MEGVGSTAISILPLCLLPCYSPYLLLTPQDAHVGNSFWEKTLCSPMSQSFITVTVLGAVLFPRVCLATSGDIFGCCKWEMEHCFWHLVGRETRMLSDILPCTGESLTTKAYLATNISRTEAEKPCLAMIRFLTDS